MFILYLVTRVQYFILNVNTFKNSNIYVKIEFQK